MKTKAEEDNAMSHTHTHTQASRVLVGCALARKRRSAQPIVTAANRRHKDAYDDIALADPSARLCKIV